jgi:cytosine/creatinine deaminase
MTTQAAFDLIFRRALTQSSAAPVDIGVKAGRIAAIAPHLDGGGEEIDLDSRLVLAGFVDTHIHLDKACLLRRCGHVHSVRDAIRAVAAMKRNFTVEDVYARGARGRSNGRSFRARPACAPMWRSIPASGCAVSRRSRR